VSFDGSRAEIQSVQTEEWLTGLGYSLARDLKRIGK